MPDWVFPNVEFVRMLSCLSGAQCAGSFDTWSVVTCDTLALIRAPHDKTRQ
jgi:hypothetical protein